MFTEELGLSELVNLEEWQKIQDSSAEVLEITIRTISMDGKACCRTSRPSRLCSEILSKIPGYSKFCGNCAAQDESTYPTTDLKNRVNFKCPLGLDVFVIPVTAVGNRTVAYIILGPVILKTRKSISEYTKDAEKLGITLEQLMDALIEINVFSYNKIHSIIDLVKHMGAYMAQTGYHKKRLGEIVPEVIEMDPLFSRYYEEKILNSLLQSCTLALNADSGSVMTLDKKTNMLHIKVASKLDKDIVNKTNIKVGEGIAGVAAATAQPIILPKDKNKNGLSKKMKRDYIKSSMIVPFNKGNNHNVYGVINLNIVRRDIDFSEKDIALVKELVKMASIALIPLHEPASQ